MKRDYSTQQEKQIPFKYLSTKYFVTRIFSFASTLCMLQVWMGYVGNIEQSIVVRKPIVNLLYSHLPL